MITWIIGPLLLRYSQRNVPIMQCDIREDLPSYRRRIFLPTNQYHFCGGVLHDILINMINSNIKRIVACYQQIWMSLEHAIPTNACQIRCISDWIKQFFHNGNATHLLLFRHERINTKIRHKKHENDRVRKWEKEQEKRKKNVLPE